MGPISGCLLCKLAFGQRLEWLLLSFLSLFSNCTRGDAGIQQAKLQPGERGWGVGGSPQRSPCQQRMREPRDPEAPGFEAASAAGRSPKNLDSLLPA